MKEDVKKAWKIDNYDEFLKALGLTPRQLNENPELRKRLINWMYELSDEEYREERREWRKKTRGKTKEEILEMELREAGVIGRKRKLKEIICGSCGYFTAKEIEECPECGSNLLIHDWEYEKDTT